MSECLFCRIVSKQIPAKVEYEDADLVAIQDIHSQAPLHLLLIPKRHLAGIADMTEKDVRMIGQLVYRAKKIAEAKKVAESGFRLVFNSGSEGGQTVFHIHLHLLAGRQMTWPPG